MEILVWAFLGGIVGAVLMDITETYAAKLGIASGVNIALVGRWFLGLLRGQLIHSNILESKPYPYEVKAGWAFHFLVGGGGVALIYPLFFQTTELPLPGNHLLSGMLFGLATSALPWFILLPSFGWGVFGWRGPQGSNALLASTLSHVPYGLGVGVMIALGS
jgi:hypothetical protein